MQIDGLIALSMALDRAEHREVPVVGPAARVDLSPKGRVDVGASAHDDPHETQPTEPPAAGVRQIAKEEVMRVLRSKKFLVLLGVIVGAGIGAAIAISASTTQVELDTTAVHLRVVKQTLDNFDSGWHVHPGLVVVTVHEGSIQFYENGCTPKTVGAGETTMEAPYQPIRAISTHAVETVTYILNAPDPVLIPLSSYSPGYNPCPSLP